jgi:hypothetical protein
MGHSMVDESVATEAVDPATLVAENASLRDRLLRALADAENTRQRAQRAAEDARQYAIADFARELLTVSDNLQRTIDAAERHQPETVEDAALIEGYERLSDSCNTRCSVSVSERSMPWASALIPPCMKQWRKWTILDHRPVRSSASQKRDTPSRTDCFVLLGSLWLSANRNQCRRMSWMGPNWDSGLIHSKL